MVRPATYARVVDFRQESLVDLAAAVRDGVVSASELTDHALERIDALDELVNAFVAVDEEAALAAARAVDRRLARGGDPGVLAGIPVGVKDLEDAAGFPTTWGSAAWEGRGPATAD